MSEKIVSSTVGGGEIDLLKENGRLRARVAALEATVARVKNHRSQDVAEVEDIFGMNALIGDGSVELSREDAKRVLSILRAPVPAALAPQVKP